jgi:hypothetical protein
MLQPHPGRAMRQAAAALVSVAPPADSWMSATWPVYAMLPPHVQAAVPVTAHLQPRSPTTYDSV